MTKKSKKDKRHFGTTLEYPGALEPYKSPEAPAMEYFKAPGSRWKLMRIDDCIATWELLYNSNLPSTIISQPFNSNSGKDWKILKAMSTASWRIALPNQGPYACFVQHGVSFAPVHHSSYVILNNDDNNEKLLMPERLKIYCRERCCIRWDSTKHHRSQRVVSQVLIRNCASQSCEGWLLHV